jgi:type III pantothenate kinase
MGTHQRLLRSVSSYLKQAGAVKTVLLGTDLRVPLDVEPGLQGVGNDRLAQALGAAQRHPGKCCLVVSAGTALVVDVLQSDGRFAGGLIGVGWHASQNALASFAPQLKVDTAEKISANYPGTTTREALWLGWLLPATAMIHSLLQSHRIEQVVLTGGEAGLLAPYLPSCDIVEYLGVDAMARSLGYFDGQ